MATPPQRAAAWPLSPTGTDLTSLTNCTVTANSAGVGGGLFSYGGLAEIQNTIVAGNTSGGSASDIETSVAGSYNLIGTGGSGGLVNGVNGNIVGVANPGLDPNGLQNNGGPTQTIALLPGSPAIDAGNNALAVDPSTGLPLITDQRGVGFPRIVNGTVDIGAFEVQTTWHFVVTEQPPGERHSRVRLRPDRHRRGQLWQRGQLVQWHRHAWRCTTTPAGRPSPAR